MEINNDVENDGIFDKDFDIIENEDGEEFVVEKERKVNEPLKSLSELIFEVVTDFEEDSEKFYLIHPENKFFIIVFVYGSVFVINESKESFVSLTEVQVVYKEMGIKEKNFWDFNCIGYLKGEFTEQQIIDNKEKW